MLENVCSVCCSLSVGNLVRALECITGANDLQTAHSALNPKLFIADSSNCLLITDSLNLYLLTKIGSCVFKVSAVECQSILTIDTSDRHSIDTQSTLH